ncbi:hypothetical protein X948_5573 [Burkholderia pseudomallei MSHR5608]|nr:hypothetical protein X948_5573 [Burkholderia pseudomallei MSHR5608]
MALPPSGGASTVSTGGAYPFFSASLNNAGALRTGGSVVLRTRCSVSWSAARIRFSSLSA